MDRGFTVEGLTVTYMPRSLGVGNADTVQQRARFFGYKRPYLGLCRIFVGPDVRRAFRSYVEHEEDVRGEMIRFSETGQPLSEWRREFFLSRQLRPTRDNVINIQYQRLRFGDDWVYPEGSHDSSDAVNSNRILFDQFRLAHPFEPYGGLDDRGANSHRNLVLQNIRLETVHAELLTRYRVSRLDDSMLFGPLLRLIQLHLIDNPDEICTVFLMAEGNRRRRGYEDDRIKELFQGRQYAMQNGKRAMTYPGDREIKAAQGITIQLNYLDLGEPNQLIAENIPHLAIWVPSEMSRDTLMQPQGGPR